MPGIRWSARSTAVSSPRSRSSLSASSACPPDSARTIRYDPAYLRRRSRATARDTPGSSSTVSSTGLDTAPPSLGSFPVVPGHTRRQAYVVPAAPGSGPHRRIGHDRGMDLRVALIGYGTGGAVFHAPLISSVPGMRLAAVVTGDPGRQRAVRERYPEAEVLDTADRRWSAPEGYDLVVVAAPSRWRVPLARTALTSGVPVVVDKPVAATAADARSLAALSAVRGLPVFPFHNRRWDGDFRTASRLVESGALGDVRRFESRFERWRPEVRRGWKESTDPLDAGGVLFDLGSHLVDQALALFGRPARVYAEIDVRRPGATAPDDVFVALEHPGGTRSHLWMSAAA